LPCRLQRKPFLKVFCRAFFQKSDRFSSADRNLIKNICLSLRRLRIKRKPNGYFRKPKKTERFFRETKKTERFFSKPIKRKIKIKRKRKKIYIQKRKRQILPLPTDRLVGKGRGEFFSEIVYYFNRDKRCFDGHLLLFAIPSYLRLV